MKRFEQSEPAKPRPSGSVGALEEDETHREKAQCHFQVSATFSELQFVLHKRKLLTLPLLTKLTRG